MLPSLSAPASRNRTAACTKPSSSSARAKSRAVYWWLPCGWFFASQTRAEASSRLLMSSGSAYGAGVGGSDGVAAGGALGVNKGEGSGVASGEGPKSPQADSSMADNSTAAKARDRVLRVDMFFFLLFGHILPWKTPGVQCIGRFFKQILRILRFFA